jgi:transposase InsO family protein
LSPGLACGDHRGPASNTRHHAPETNGVVARFNQTIKYEHLWRLEIPDVISLEDEAEDFRHIYNTIRPHESLCFRTPITAYLAHPGSHLSEPKASKNLDARHD